MKRARRGRFLVLSFLVVATLVVLDQWSKGAVFAWLGDGHPELVRDCHPHVTGRYLVAGRWLSLMTSCNAGAAFGQLDSFPRTLVGGRVLAVLFLSIWLVRMDPRPRLVPAAMVLVLSGAIGNVIDNLWTGCGSATAPHGVRDFVNVWFEPVFGWDYHFPSFNVADACISVGAVLWILSGFLHTEPQEEDPVPAGGGPPPATGVE